MSSPRKFHVRLRTSEKSSDADSQTTLRKDPTHDRISKIVLTGVNKYSSESGLYIIEYQYNFQLKLSSFLSTVYLGPDFAAYSFQYNFFSLNDMRIYNHDKIKYQ